MVAINRKRIRGQSRRTRGSMNKERVGVLSLALLGIVFFVWRALRSGTTPAVISGDQHALEEANSCGLWLGASSVQPGTLGLFTGVNKAPGQRVAEPDLLIPIFDANVNEFSPWQAFALPAVVVMGLHMQSVFRSELFSPGITSMIVGAQAPCSDDLANMKVEHGEKQDSVGVHRSRHPAAGSFSYHYNFAYQATRALQPGEELVLPCTQDATPSPEPPKERKGLPITSLQQQGMCMDNLSVAPSTLPGVGRGAFSKHSVPSGHVIAPTPVIHFDRSQTEILDQTTNPDRIIPLAAKHGIRYTDKVMGEQLLLNYCFGHPDSNILLLPYAPAVNFINHSREKANAVLRWSPLADSAMLAENPNLLIDQPARHGLFLEYVALRDIAVGEEIFIDYGNDWIAAWDKHVRDWKAKPEEAEYMNAVEFTSHHGAEPIRTQNEQTGNPYPDNLQTACFFMADTHFNEGLDQTEWKDEHFDCLRPCDIKERSGSGRDTFYTAVVYPMDIAKEPDNCGHIPRLGVVVTRIPGAGVGIMDERYSTDTFLDDAFRHNIGVPEGLFPTAWNAADPNPLGDFIISDLKTGQLEPVRWKDTGEVVTDHGYRLGLGDRVQKKILEYCNKIGITETLRKTTSYANGMEVDQNTFLDLEGASGKWYLQRPGGKWRADMHWMSPGDEKSTQDWLEMLSEAGFDEILKGIGESLGLNGLVAFHGSFMGISTSTKHYIHYDIQKTGNKHFNIIIPLILANETGPELDLRDSIRTESDGNLKYGRYPYENGVAIVLGDNAFHATSPVNYRKTKEFRLSATIFVADVSEDIVDSIMHEYTQVYPPKDRDLLLSWAGKHWRKDDPSYSLPKPNSDHILLAGKTAAS